MLYYLHSFIPCGVKKAGQASGQFRELSGQKEYIFITPGLTCSHHIFNVDDPSSRSSGRWETWDEEDTKLLERKFRKEDSLPSTVVIRTMCQKDKDLVEILDRKGWNRLYTKIRNMFKKKKRDARH